MARTTRAAAESARTPDGSRAARTAAAPQERAGPAERTRAPGPLAEARAGVVWQEDETSIYAKKFDGASWIELGGSTTGNGASVSAKAHTPAVAVNAAGAPTIAWVTQSTTPEQIYVRIWNGSAWVELGASATGGGVSNTSGMVQAPSLALDALGRPFVAWADADSGRLEVHFRRWDGSAWVEVPTGSASGGGISNTESPSVQPALVVSPGFVWAAWEDSGPESADVFLRRVSLP